VIHTNGVCNEESWSLINSAFSGTARCCSRGAAANEDPSDRISRGRAIQFLSPPCRRIRLALRELGYVEGQNTAIEYYHYAEGKPDRNQEPIYCTLVLDLRRRHVGWCCTGWLLRQRRAFHLSSDLFVAFFAVRSMEVLVIGCPIKSYGENQIRSIQ